MRALLAAALLWSGPAWGQGGPKPPGKVPCRAITDVAGVARPIVERLTAALREQRHVSMTVAVIYNAGLRGPAFGGGDTPPLSDHPVGTIWLGPEFIDNCNDANIMAIVLAHELGHIYLGHSKTNLEEWLTWRGEQLASSNDMARRRAAQFRVRESSAVARHEATFGPTAGGRAGYGEWELQHAALRQRQEERADQFSAVIAAQAGYDARNGGSNFYLGFAHTWPALNETDYLSTHPRAQDRVAGYQYWADQSFPNLAALLP